MEPIIPTDGPMEARYTAYLGTITQLRPRLHRYCSRMTGSVLDGEDVVQEALFEAYRKLDQFDSARPLTPWIFRIAHNRCLDFLRRRGTRDAAELSFAESEATLPTDPALAVSIGPAIEHMVSVLPPLQRACILLKDVFDYSLEEVAELVGSTVGGVKAALNRARTKLSQVPALDESVPVRVKDPGEMRLLQLYVERFNDRDWDGVRELVRADARLQVVDAFSGRLNQSPYFTNYSRWQAPWRLTLGQVDGETVVVVLLRDANAWATHSFMRVNVGGGVIDSIVDYGHCPWIAPAAKAIEHHTLAGAS